MFTKTHTNIVKFIAILIMYFHHLFSNFATYIIENGVGDISFYPFQSEFIIFIGNFGRICITFFALLSGYGLAKSWINKCNQLTLKNYGRFIAHHLLSLMSSYWFVFILSFLMIGILTPDYRNLIDIYGQSEFWKNVLLDFLGLSTLFQTPSMNASWWYITVAQQIIFFIPVIVSIRKCYKIILMVLMGLIVYHAPVDAYFIDYYFMFYFAAVVGTIYAQYSLFDKLLIEIKCNKIIKIIWITALLIIALLIRILGGLSRIIACIIAILVCNLVVILFDPNKGEGKKITILIGTVLKNSYLTNMYLIHSFFATYYFIELIYAPKHFLLIFLNLFFITYFISIILEMVKNKIKAQKLFAKWTTI